MTATVAVTNQSHVIRCCLVCCDMRITNRFTFATLPTALICGWDKNKLKQFAERGLVSPKRRPLKESPPYVRNAEYGERNAARLYTEADVVTLCVLRTAWDAGLGRKPGLRAIQAVLQPRLTGDVPHFFLITKTDMHFCKSEADVVRFQCEHAEQMAVVDLWGIYERVLESRRVSGNESRRTVASVV